MSWNDVPGAEWLDSAEAVKRAVDYLYEPALKRGLGYDTETTGTHIARDLPVLFSMSDGVRRYCAPAEFLSNPNIKKRLLENPKIAKVGTNLKFDAHMTANAGVELKGPLRCTLAMDWLYDENRQGRHGLKDTAWDHIRLRMFGSFREVFKPKPKTKTRPAETPGAAIERKMSTPEGKAQAIDYSSMDAFASVLVHDALAERLEYIPFSNDGKRNLLDYFNEVEAPYTRVLWNMERRGFQIYTGHLKTLAGPIVRELADIEADLAGEVGRPINPKSSYQLRELFFDELGYTPLSHTKPGKKTGVSSPQTDERFLKHHAADGCKISKLLLRHRKLIKIYGTYVQGMLLRVDKDARLHTTLNQHVTVTGRLSSSKPNLQNIPTQTEDDPWLIRAAFGAYPGRRLVVLDYDQLEMKIMAHFSKDAKMIEAILTGQDLHCFTVAMMANIPYEQVMAAKKAKDRGEPITDQQKHLLMLRHVMKRTGFGILYGIGRNKLAAQLSEQLKKLVTPKEAQGYIDGYLGVYKGVKQHILDIHEECRRTECVRTISGRYRRLPTINVIGGAEDDDDINASKIVAQAERQAQNTEIQGSAADICKAAMIIAEYDPQLHSLGAQMEMQIHDELIFSCADDDEVADAVIKRAKEIMEHPGIEMLVPLTAAGGSGLSWLAAKH